MKNKMALVCLFVLLAALLTVVTGCSSSQKLIPKDTETSFPLSPDLGEVLYYASLAPNGHNTQPWKLGISADEKVLRLYIDSSRLLPAADPEGRESLISLGAFLENLTRSLGVFGYRYTLVIFDSINITDNPFVAEIIIHGTPTVEPPVRDSPLVSMEKRHTEKSVFLNKTLESSSVERLLATLKITEKTTKFVGL
jgi:hypothetical protein